MLFNIVNPCIFLMILVQLPCLISKKITKNPKSDHVKDRGLIAKRIKASSIIEEHEKYSKQHAGIKFFPGTSLLLVNPSNPHGYEIAKIFGSKFDFVAPVWFSIRRNRLEFVIGGDLQINDEWLTEMKKHEKTKIVPRLVFDDWSHDEFDSLYWNKKAGNSCVKVILDFYKEHHFDGVVVDIWPFWLKHRRIPDELTIHFLKELGASLKLENLIFILEIPPPIYYPDIRGIFNRDHLLSLSNEVDYFHLQTDNAYYDISHQEMHGNVRSLSPLSWVQNCLYSLLQNEEYNLQKKILVGLNLQGMMIIWGKEQFAINGSRFIGLLKKHDPELRWDESVAEHAFEFEEGGRIGLMYYPTLYSIKLRLKLFKSHGSGLAIADGSVGLDYFFDLF